MIIFYELLLFKFYKCITISFLRSQYEPRSSVVKHDYMLIGWASDLLLYFDFVLNVYFVVAK